MIRPVYRGSFLLAWYVVVTVLGLLARVTAVASVIHSTGSPSWWSGAVATFEEPPTTSPSYPGREDDSNYLVTHDFEDADGIQPNGLVVAANGVLFGTASSGGAHGRGTLYSVADPAGTPRFTLLHSFGASDDPLGHTPVPNALVVAPDGIIYGAMRGGGEYGGGTIFKITPEGEISRLRAISAAEGLSPVALLMGGDGHLYGLTAGSGSTAPGSLFRMTTAGEVTVLWQIPGELTVGLRLGSNEASLVSAGGGDLYFAMGGQNIYRYSQNSGQTQVAYFADSNSAFRANLVPAANGALWAAESGWYYGRLARFTPGGAPGGLGETFASARGTVVSLLSMGEQVLASLSTDDGRSLWQFGPGMTPLESLRAGPALRCLTHGIDRRIYAVRLHMVHESGLSFRVGRSQVVSIALPPNHDPIAGMDRIEESAGILEEAQDGPTRTYQINVLGNDADTDGDVLTVTSVSRPDVTINADGTLSFIQRLAMEPTVRFTYTVSDGRGGVARGLVRIGNRAPVAQPDMYLRPEQFGPNGRLDVLANDTDPDGDSLRIVEVSWNPDVTWPSTGTEIYYRRYFVWPPTLGIDVHPGRFTYTISDGEAQATGNVRVGNHLPVAFGERLNEATEIRQLPNGITEFVYHFAPLANDSDPEGEALHISQIGIVSDQFTVSEDNVLVDPAPPVGRTTLNADGTITFTTTAAGGRGTFLYTVSDPYGSTATAYARFGNAVPVAENDAAYAAPSDSRFVSSTFILPLENDTDQDADPLRIVSVSSARFGNTELIGDQVYYTPGQSYTEYDEFTYTVTDDQGGSATARIRITNPLYKARGTYIGSVRVPGFPDSVGTFRVRLMGGGAYTGALTLEGKTFPLKGFIPENGWTVRVINRPPQKPLELHLSVSSTPQGGRILEGVVSVGRTPEGHLIRVAYIAKAEKTVFNAEAGRYTVALPVDTALPGSGQSGHGFA